MNFKKLLTVGATGATVVTLLAGATTAFASTATSSATAGTLGFVAAPGDVSFPAVAMTGLDQTVTTTLALDVSDATGSNLGWNISISGTAWTGPTGGNLANTAATVTAASAATCDTNSTCTIATNSVTYSSLTVPLGATVTAAKIYNAAAATGEGNQNYTSTFAVAVPGNTTAGTYSSTWTVSLNSAP